MNFISSLKEYKAAYITFFILIVIIAYGMLRSSNVEKNGVITICRVDSYSPDSDGSSTYCTIFLAGREYHVVSGMGTKDMVGKYYFVKTLKKDPAYEIIFDNEVPLCILLNPIPPE